MQRIVICGAIGAHRVKHGEIVHGAGVALFGRELVPGLRLGDVTVDADALFGSCRSGIALARSRVRPTLVPLRRLLLSALTPRPSA